MKAKISPVKFNDLLSTMHLKMRLTSQPSDLHSSFIMDQSFPTKLTIAWLLHSIKILDETSRTAMISCHQILIFPITLTLPLYKCPAISSLLQDPSHKSNQEHQSSLIYWMMKMILSQLCLFDTVLWGCLCTLNERDTVFSVLS